MTTQKVDFWFDTLCPWAWMTSRWLSEVEKVRDISVQWNVMSLYYLNKDREGIGQKYLDHASDALAPLRVITQASQMYGDEISGKLYTAFGTKIHLGKMKFSDELISTVLSEEGLPASLMQSAHDDALDEKILDSHNRGMSLVGEDVGTPIIAIGEVAFFGPVISPAPKGEAAGKLFDGVLAVTSYPGFFELKRSRTVGPIFD